MPRYLIVRRKGESQNAVIIGYTEPHSSIRSAWGWFKKNHKRKILKGWSYHLFAINHARWWEQNKEGKWEIHSWYNNHKIKSRH